MDIKYIKTWPNTIELDIPYPFALIKSNNKEYSCKHIKGCIILTSGQITITYNDINYDFPYDNVNFIIHDFWTVMQRMQHLKMEYAGDIINILFSILPIIKKNKTITSKYIKVRWPTQIKQNAIYSLKLIKNDVDEKELLTLLNLIIIDDLTKLIKDYLIEYISIYLVLRMNEIILTHNDIDYYFHFNDNHLLKILNGRSIIISNDINAMIGNLCNKMINNKQFKIEHGVDVINILFLVLESMEKIEK